MWLHEHNVEITGLIPMVDDATVTMQTVWHSLNTQTLSFRSGDQVEVSSVLLLLYGTTCIWLVFVIASPDAIGTKQSQPC